METVSKASNRRSGAVRRRKPHQAAKKGGSEVLFQRILVPLDFSKGSLSTIPFAVRMARSAAAAADLLLLHVVELHYGGTELAVIDFPLLEKECLDEAARKLEETRNKELPSDLSVRLLTVSGRPVQEIVTAAEKQKADLVIISSHGRTGLPHLFLGSTAENVVRRCKCPVLVVPQQKHSRK